MLVSGILPVPFPETPKPNFRPRMVVVCSRITGRGWEFYAGARQSSDSHRGLGFRVFQRVRYGTKSQVSMTNSITVVCISISFNSYIYIYTHTHTYIWGHW